MTDGLETVALPGFAARYTQPLFRLSVALAKGQVLLLRMGSSPPEKEALMNSKQICPALLYTALVFSLPLAISAKAQLAGEDNAAKPQELTNTGETKAQPNKNSAKPGTLLQTKSFTLEGDNVWLDTGISLQPGQRIVVSAKGSLRYSDAKEDNGPDGLTRNFKDLIRILPDNSVGRGAVLGRIGDADIAQAFVIGAKKDVVAPISGKFSLGINQAESDTGTGSYKVKVEVYAADDSTPREIAKEVPGMAGIDNDLFEKIPRRIGDKVGNPGDMVNFLILGDETQMKNVFTSAGWVKVDADVKATLVEGFIASM